MRTIFIALPLLALAACGDNEAQNNATAMLPPENEQAAMPAEGVVPSELPDAAANQASNDAAEAGAGENDRFAGRWTGPEGLYAQITPAAQPGRYSVEMQYTLDDRGTFTATQAGNGLAMTRTGQQVTLTPGTGDETGMKWLAGKRDCLVAIRGSEGYCRD